MGFIEFIGQGGVRLRGDAFGSVEDPIVLLLPAAGQQRSELQEAARALAAAGRYAICLDLRGHGDSDWAPDGGYDLEAYVADIKAILRQLNQRPFVVAVGLSGLAAAVALGEGGTALASGLALVNVAPWMNPAEVRNAIDELRSRHSGCEQTAPSVRWDPRVVGGLQLARALLRLRSAVRGLSVPTLILRGAESEMVPDAAVRRLQGLIPAAELVSLEGAGRMPPSERSEEFNAALLEFLERRAPRAASTYEAGSDPRTLRNSLGCFGTGVTVVTTFDGERRPVGLTANSFTSVSLDPPLVLFCLAKNSRSLTSFDEAERFTINVLQIGQQRLSRQFTGPAEERFKDVEWESWDGSAPVLPNCLAAFDCRRESAYDAGDHRIYVGRVERASFDTRRDPLLYFRGKYQRLHFS